MAGQSLVLEPYSEGGITLWLSENENKHYLGDLICDVDGFYKFFPSVKSGYWSEHILQLILDKLKEMNEAWENDIKEYFENSERESKREETPELDEGCSPLDPFPPRK